MTELWDRRLREQVAAQHRATQNFSHVVGQISEAKRLLRHSNPEIGEFWSKVGLDIKRKKPSFSHRNKAKQVPFCTAFLGELFVQFMTVRDSSQLIEKVVKKLKSSADCAMEDGNLSKPADAK